MSPTRIRWAWVIAAFVALATSRALAGAQVNAKSSEPRLREAFASIKGFSFLMDNDPWGRSICTMVDAGREPGGLDVLLNELRDTDAARLQRTIPLAVAEIGDRRAIPYLIYALA